MFVINQPPLPQAEASPDAQCGMSAGEHDPDPGVFTHSHMWQQVYEQPRPTPHPDGQVVGGPDARLADDGLDTRQTTLSVTPRQTTQQERHALEAQRKLQDGVADALCKVWSTDFTD